MQSPEQILAEWRTIAIVGASPKPAAVEDACTAVVHRKLVRA